MSSDTGEEARGVDSVMKKSFVSVLSAAVASDTRYSLSACTRTSQKGA